MWQSLLKGIIYCFLWYSSILCGFLTLCSPSLVLLLFSHKTYRKITDLIFATWELYPVALMEVMFGTEFIISGDQILPWERSILIMNHRTRLDWNFLWGAMHYATDPPAHRLKFILKSAIRHIPGPGWVMQTAGFFYIHRKWEQDKNLLSSQLEYLRDLDHTYQVLIFPEGTDLTKQSIEKSNSYAAKNNLPSYSKVLHPKTTGFVYLASKMVEYSNLDAIYDLTVGYPGHIPQTEIDLLKGIAPLQVFFSIKRYPLQVIPRDSDNLKNWLCKIWEKKEVTLEKFYETGHFDDNIVTKKPPNDKSRLISNSLHLSIIFWTLLIAITYSFLIISVEFQLWCLFNCLLFILLSFTSNGLQQIELTMFKVKNNRY